MQTVYYNNSFSEFKRNNYSVTHRSILGPSLLIMYVNDLPKYIKSDSLTSCMYADDICFECCMVRSLSKDAIDISFNTGLVVDWCNTNNLLLNIWIKRRTFISLIGQPSVSEIPWYCVAEQIKLAELY